MKTSKKADNNKAELEKIRRKIDDIDKLSCVDYTQIPLCEVTLKEV